ncbi:MAG: stalk domain-containing protein [Candidatus Pristimantibacillus sp.]
MFRKRYLAILLFIVIAGSINLYPKVTHADSPLTSTSIYQAYLDVEIVAEAHSDGLTDNVAAFLASDRNSLDERAAVINAIYSSVQWEDRNFADDYAQLIYRKPADSLDIEALSGDAIFVLGYFKALDHYLTPDSSWLTLAREELPNSMTVALIHALVKSQEALVANGESWCYMESIYADQNLEQDIRQEAITIINDYMILYKVGECSEETTELIDHSIILLINHPEVLVYGTKTTADPTNSNIVPFVRKGTTLVPLRFIASAFGAEVNYNHQRQEASIRYGDTTLIFDKNNKAVPFETQNGRTFVPLRMIAEALNMQVYYNKGLIILSKEYDLKPLYDDQVIANKVLQELL